MRTLVLILSAFLAITAAPAVALRAQAEHEGDKQDEKEPKRIDHLHGQHQDLINNDHEPKGKGHEVLGPSIFASTTVGVVFFIVGMVGWIALSIATWILLQKQPPRAPS